MTTGQNEWRMMWLISLVIVALSAWYLDYTVVSYLCGLGFLMSVMQYVNAVQQPLDQLHTQDSASWPAYSKVPLYISSLVAIVGGVIDLKWLMGLGVTVWIFFLLRWLQRLEQSLRQLQHRIHAAPTLNPTESASLLGSPDPKVETEHSALGLMEQIQRWIFQGNPVLKAAIGILVVGIILLLRFATEHWQISLAIKLGVIALVSLLVTGLGYSLVQKNRSFALALEGLGLGALFLTLFFAYYNLVIPDLLVAAVLFVLIMAITLYLSFRQNSFELAIMALLIAYLAPFTLPVRNATAVELIAYYLVINIGVATLTSLKPWKILNQIAFLVTAIVGGAYALIHGYSTERYSMTALILAHSAVFIWLGFRFSQLLVQHDLQQFRLKPILDIGLIFTAPISAYIFLYLIHFDDRTWQAGLSLIYAVVFAGCWLWSRRSHTLNLIANSYLSLMLIFIALIPPILLEGEWSVIGWAIEGVLIYSWALEKQLKVGQYLSMGLLIMAGLSSLYYLVELNPTPRHIFWTLSGCYLVVILFSQLKDRYIQQLDELSTSFLSLLSFSASLMLFALLQDEFNATEAHVYSLAIVVLIYVALNEIILRKNQHWSWLIPKWCGLSLLMLIGVVLVFEHSQNTVLVWDNQWARVIFGLATVLLTWQWLRPSSGLLLSKEWFSLGALGSLTLASMCLIPSMPYISMVILPLALCFWSYKQARGSAWPMLWQSNSTLVLMAAWLLCSQLLSQQAFQYYLLPVLNPFDLVSIAMLVSFIWMLLQQVQAGRDKGMMAVLMVLSLLWLCSYILLRALHRYFGTPLNSLEVWSNATVQLSLTILWVLLAFATMWIATLKLLKPMWILGGSILVMVTLKLVLFDLSHIGTLTRVLSFLLAGGVMLLIAYVAPMPDGEKRV